MNIALKAKTKLLMRTFPKPAQWIIRQLLDDSESTEARLHRELDAMKTEMWYWKDRYMDEFMKKLH